MGAGIDLFNQIDTLGMKQDWAGVGSLFTADIVHVDPVGRHEGREALVAYLEDGYKGFSDITTTTSLVIEQGDTTVVEYLWRATHTGAFTAGDGTVVPATGKTQELPCVSIVQVKDGKIANMRDYFDVMTTVTQLGLTPL